jgi:hypothetical protein
MVLAGLSNYLKPSIRGWRGHETRSLREAAHLARALAEAENLPIGKALAQDGSIADRDGWYAESILNTIPVYASRGGAPECVGARAGLRLTDGAQNLGRDGEPVWRDLHAKREDFARYVEWLRSVW